MANTALSDTPWLDILPPPAPVDHSLLIIVIILAITALLLFGLYQFWQTRPRQRALKQLHKLQGQLDRRAIENRQCLYEIHRLLCMGLGLNQLAQLEHKKFYQQLSAQQYRADAPQEEDTRRLLHEAQLILRQAGV